MPHEPLRALHHIECAAAAVILDAVVAHELSEQRQTRLVGQNRVVRLQSVPANGDNLSDDSKTHVIVHIYTLITFSYRITF